MNEFAQLTGYFVVLFAISMAVAWLIAQIMLATKRCPDPAIGTCLRMRGPAGMYRTRIVQARGSQWVLSAPLMRDHYVPLHVGERLSVEMPLDDGVMFFKTVIRSRDVGEHTLTIERPVHARKSDRRAERRIVEPNCGPVGLEGVPSRLVDICSVGARLTSSRSVQTGERVRVDLPWMSAPTFGWVLDVIAVNKAQIEARVRFEQPVRDLPK